MKVKVEDKMIQMKQVSGQFQTDNFQGSSSGQQAGSVYI